MATGSSGAKKISNADMNTYPEKLLQDTERQLPQAISSLVNFNLEPEGDHMREEPSPEETHRGNVSREDPNREEADGNTKKEVSR